MKKCLIRLRLLTNQLSLIKLEPSVISGNDVLTVTDLTKSFDGNTLFNNINFEIKRGERVALIGNNGTGKTTILKLINGIIPPDSGSIYLGAKVAIGNTMFLTLTRLFFRRFRTHILTSTIHR